jgi:hypothetical protein
MTTDEKKTWLQNFLKNCLGEELPNIQGQYTFGYHKLLDTQVLAEIPTVVMEGRMIKTFELDMFIEKCANIEVLTKESFALMCTNDPGLHSWYLWNIDRGRIAI